jgi:hypothetical protein
MALPTRDFRSGIALDPVKYVKVVLYRAAQNAQLGFFNSCHSLGLAIVACFKKYASIGPKWW